MNCAKCGQPRSHKDHAFYIDYAGDHPFVSDERYAFASGRKCSLPGPCGRHRHHEFTA